jgi:GNAT superfamily N-acetyltransferase
MRPPEPLGHLWLQQWPWRMSARGSRAPWCSAPTRAAALLGRLAVDRRHHGLGLGRALVADALRRSLAARRLVGARALLVHAIDEQAAAFYRSLGFRPSPLSATTLMLQLCEPAD